MSLTNLCINKKNLPTLCFGKLRPHPPTKQYDIVHVETSKWACQGVKEMRFSGDTLLTGVLLFASGANRSADGASI